MLKLISLDKDFKGILRWALVGSSTAVLDYILFIYLYSLTSSILISNLMAGIFSISFNYTFHFFWTFKSKSEHKKSSIKFTINLIILWFLGTFLLKLLIELDFDPKIAKLIPIIFTTPISFFTLKFIVFRGLS